MMKPASTLLVIRDTPDGLEVLMGTRPDSARFAPGALVFPGGVVDERDGDDLAMSLGGDQRDPWKMAAVRETYEETGVLVAVEAPRSPYGADFFEALSDANARVHLDLLIHVSTWVTPAFLPQRYDTRFYVAAHHGDPLVVDSDELSGVGWISPRAALADWQRGRVTAISPTRAHLEWLAMAESFTTIRDNARLGRHASLIDQAVVEGVRPPGLEHVL